MSKAAATKTYIALTYIDAGVRKYDVGEEIELTESQAAQLLELNPPSVVDPSGAKQALKDKDNAPSNLGKTVTQESLLPPVGESGPSGEKDADAPKSKGTKGRRK